MSSLMTLGALTELILLQRQFCGLRFQLFKNPASQLESQLTHP